MTQKEIKISCVASPFLQKSPIMIFAGLFPSTLIHQPRSSENPAHQSRGDFLKNEHGAVCGFKTREDAAKHLGLTSKKTTKEMEK